MQLYNKLSKKERLDLINKAGERRLTLSFYKYHQIKNTTIFRNYLFIEWDKLDVLGRIYIAHEGINAQLSVPSNRMIEFKNSIDTISFLNGIRLNIAIEHDNEAFLKLKIKVRDKIVADGLGLNDYNLDKNGVHVNAEKFNELLDNKETITIDMRNHYESEIGHFKGAKLPDVDTFRESLPIINKKYDKHKKNKNINIIIFLIPKYRYIFILFMYRFLWLKRELQKSFLRKFICIFTSILLIISHISYLDEYIVINIVFFALFIITFSFAKDIIWLYGKKNENM